MLCKGVKMQTVEFDTYVENGVIAIPSQYQDVITRSVRVILLPKDETPEIPQNSIKRKEVYSLAVDMTGFTFDRNEANER
jgi:hypothetical protein